MTPQAADRRSAWIKWLSSWTLLSLPGMGAALLSWGPARVVSMTVLLAAMSMVVLLLLRLDRSDPDTSPRLGPPLPLAQTSACVVTLAVSALAAATVLPALLLLLLALQVGTSPPVVDRWRRFRRDRRVTRTADLETPADPARDGGARDTPNSRAVTAEPLPGVDDLGLCRAWRRSYWVLHDATEPSDVLAAVALRARLLEELERRDPRAVAAWLDSGARPSGGPERYLGGEDAASG